MYEIIKESIEEVITTTPPDAVLFSGGVDSSAILWHSYKNNPNVIPITVGVEGKESSDIEYSKKVAEQLGIENHQICYVTEKDVKDMVEVAVCALKSFNPEWISSTTTLLLGTMFAKHKGLKSISGGEGADDLFGSFPFFKNWKGDAESLDVAIRDRLNEIAVMSDVVAQVEGMKYITPFHAPNVKETILNIPIQERTKVQGEITTKYPLRMAYKDDLPPICITRPQTMAFTGSGIYETIRSIGNDISDEEFESACQDIFEFRNKFEYALFKLYKKHFKFEQIQNGGCIHCGCDMGGNRINCRVCNTLQIDGKEISFNGDESNQNGEIRGAEAIVIHKGNVVLGMQKSKRWYTLEDGQSAAIIKTLGGQIEPEDEGDLQNTLKRELLEELNGIAVEDMNVKLIFTKTTQLGELNPFEKDHNLSMKADFFIVEISADKKITPNDLPALIEIPLREFLKLDFSKKMLLYDLPANLKRNIELTKTLPQQCALMIPDEAKEYLETLKIKSEPEEAGDER